MSMVLEDDTIIQSRFENQSRKGSVIQWQPRNARFLVSHPFYLALPAYGHGHLFAAVRHDPISWDARHLEKPPSPRAGLARLYASAVSRTENVGRTGPLEPGGVHGGAFPPRAEGRPDPAPAQGWDALSRGRWQWETQAGDTESLGPKRAEKRASAVVFGIRIVLLIATWDVYRFPVAFRLIRVKTHPEYRTENALFREMVRHFGSPVWAKRIIVEGAAAYGSQMNMKMVMQRDADAPDRRWEFVLAMARTWKTVEGKALKDLVTHMPRKHYQRTRILRLPGAQGSKTFWIYSKRLCLRHIGDVTMVLSKKGRHSGPKHAKILVTNLDEWTPRQVVCAY
jgi:hypothetical protein